MELTCKERWLLALNREQVDRLIFWPKIFNKSYTDHQTQQFKNMSIREIHDYVGSDIQQYLPEYLEPNYGDCSYSEEYKGDYHIKTYTTPHGKLVSRLKYDPSTDSYHPDKLPIETLEDIKLMTCFFENMTMSVNSKLLSAAKTEYNDFGDRGLMADGISESPLMDFVEWYAGIENGQYLLCDYPDELEVLFDSMQKINESRTQLKCENSPADVLYFTENTSTTIISPTQFNTFCKPHLKAYSDICSRHNRRLIVHMCGHIRTLLPDMTDIGFHGIEALTTAPVGNTTFAQAKNLLPKKSFIGGTNCLTWLQSADDILKEINTDLAQLDDYLGIVVGTGGIIPSACTPDTLKTVCRGLFSLHFKNA